jgi:energy-coupling factor transport system substrate-specific component
MNPEEVSASRFQRVGNVLVWVGGIGGAAVGLFLGFSAEQPLGLGIGLGVAPFLILVVIGSFMLGGREQVEAAQEMIAAEDEESEVEMRPEGER